MPTQRGCCLEGSPVGSMATLDNTTRQSVVQEVRSVLAATCACDIQYFDAEGVTIVDAVERPGRLRFRVWSKPLIVATTGAGVVVSCHPERREWLRANLGQLRRDAVFSPTTIGKLARFVARD